MPTQEQLEYKSTKELAVLCQCVADNSIDYTDAASDEAWELKREWVLLRTPPDADVKKQRENETSQAALHKRMAEFLASIL